MKYKLVTILLVMISSFLSANTDDFIYDEDKLTPGTLYTYKTSDFNGNEVSYEYVYIKDNSTVETLRDHSNSSGSVWHTIETISKEFFMFDTLDFRTLATTSEEYNKGGIVTLDFKNRKESYTVHKIKKGKEREVSGFDEIDKEAQYPYYHAGNNIPDLNIFCRFLNLNKKEIEVGISDVWAKIDNYTLSYVKHEKINGEMCVKYELRTKGLLAKAFKKHGAIWIKKNDPNQIMVKYQLNQRISWTLKNEMAVLQDVKELSYDQWQDFILDKKTEIEKGLGF